MKFVNISLLFTLLFFASCGEEKKPAESPQEETPPSNTAAPVKEAMLSQQQYDALGMKIDTLGTRLMTGFVEANGELEVPPQNEATVTPVIGGNVANIRVIEGEKVKKGSVLASIEHPDIIKIQTDFINAVNQRNFQEKEFQRQQKLYDAGVGSGETFQRAEAEFQSVKGQVYGLEAQLRQLNINPATIKNGNIQRQIPILSPIDGAVQAVNIKTGQFVQAQTNMFEIINTEHVHVDLLVFEKDVAKVEKGQTVKFSVESLPGTELTAEIISISQNFEQDPKALHVHAEIKNRPDNLVPGMYVRGKIAVDDKRSIALPESALAKDGDKFFVFTAEEEGDAWSFKPVKVIPGTAENGWIEIKLLEDLPADTRFAFNNAYYLMAEMNKGEGGHSH
ncbi:efflux RND transporter periplasmic adaptor subunit [Salegentibacter salegens]|uniref:Membrane fusion protein, cobalt-zinc-cadmium efflux system n=1 Tax=Salegentibacter salegens TaxID=143223 RepID=A0A1M7I6G2_9FLAO|nr:efflux RND transporter periplasmic adaptor subunit [Salegentibacter salegens]PRX47961.1 cobalt-zinc-cadmium efflux system membrane fusion protein [Salegentibacter salegens]SHM36238.1 membrane fusion protein, cobalt-zinc-cadmium efflux system [Salegentibacter salegens]